MSIENPYPLVTASTVKPSTSKLERFSDSKEETRVRRSLATVLTNWSTRVRDGVHSSPKQRHPIGQNMQIKDQKGLVGILSASV